MSIALRINRTLSYPIDRVWRALTDPTALTGWFWPQRFEPTVDVAVPLPTDPCPCGSGKRYKKCCMRR